MPCCSLLCVYSLWTPQCWVFASLVWYLSSVLEIMQVLSFHTFLLPHFHFYFFSRTPLTFHVRLCYLGFSILLIFYLFLVIYFLFNLCSSSLILSSFVSCLLQSLSMNSLFLTCIFIFSISIVYSLYILWKSSALPAYCSVFSMRSFYFYYS